MRVSREAFLNAVCAIAEGFRITVVNDKKVSYAFAERYLDLFHRKRL